MSQRTRSQAPCRSADSASATSRGATLTYRTPRPLRVAPDASEETWTQYVYVRDNPCGPHDELWFHGTSCRRWFVVRRDTRTHEILASRMPDGVDRP